MIDVVAPISRESFLDTFENANRPVVIEGALRSWPAFSLWTSSYIREKCGSNMVYVRTYPNGSHRECRYQYIAMDKLLASAEGSDKESYVYLARSEISGTIPQIANDLRIPEFVPAREVELNTIWIGRSTFTRLHFHVGVEAASCLIRGQKRFWLWPPSSSEQLRPHSFMRSNFNFSRLHDDDGLGPEGLDGLPGATSVLLREGQILYIPVGWWHAVTGSEDMSVLNVLFWSSRIRNWQFPYPGLPSLFWSLYRRPIRGLARSLVGF
jgi:Cupin-like domain